MTVRYADEQPASTIAQSNAAPASQTRRLRARPPARVLA